VDNRHLVPFSLDHGILVNIPQRLLFLFRDGRLVAWYPVAVGRRDWPTAAGRFRIDSLERNPTWNVPASIQEEMKRRGVTVKSRVPPGPANPLGDYWIGFEGSGCGIHGTNAPASIYTFRTHGCVRLHPDDIADLFSGSFEGMTVEFVYEPILLARAPDGAVFLEVNADVYGRQGDPGEIVAALAERQNLRMALDPAMVGNVIAEREGLARRVDVPVRLLENERDLSVEAIANDSISVDLGFEILDVDRSDVVQRLRSPRDSLRRRIFPALFGLSENLDDFQHVRHKKPPCVLHTQKCGAGSGPNRPGPRGRGRAWPSWAPVHSYPAALGRAA
jgi:L,D-transpeptidase ErfK/SrfK